MSRGPVNTFITLCSCILIQAAFFPYHLLSQCPPNPEVYQKILTIEKDGSLPEEKLSALVSLQKGFEECRGRKDSVYARLLHRIGSLKYKAGKPNEGISDLLTAVRINTSENTGGNPKFAVNSYFNLGYFFAELGRYQDAVAYYDLCTLTWNKYQEAATLVFAINAYDGKAYIHYQTGDFQKSVEQATIGLRMASLKKDSVKIMDLLTKRAQAYAEIGQIDRATADMNNAWAISKKDYFTGIANNYKTNAAIKQAAGRYAEAMATHDKVILLRGKTYDTAALAGDYLDAGNTAKVEAVSKGGNNFSEALYYYNKALELAKKSGNINVAIKATNNLATIAFRKRSYTESLQGYHTGLRQIMSSFRDEKVLNNPGHRQCNTVSDKNFLSMLLANKVECLLHVYKQTGDKNYLKASLRTALLTDSVITDMRHEQTGEQSKLYWRNETRDFFINAIEASYLAKDAGAALYFMEKSRAVLLNDKLNELGAAAHLPPAEAAEEQKLQINVFSQQQKVAGLAAEDAAYNEEELKLFSARETLQRYIATLQTKYPAYYQYKYADAVPSLPQLQQHLSASGQTFVHYFVSDSAVYSLAITPSSSTFLKQAKANINSELSLFINTCADRQGLNNNYGYFASQAHNLYRILVKPLALPKASVIICSDGVTVPFETFTTDAGGKNFLVNDYRFSYVYSAQTLLKKFTNPLGKGNLLGVAPVSYAATLSVPPLQQSANALQKAASFFSGSSLLANSEANRANLLTFLPRYTIVAILSHARADSTDKEPILFMADSLIRLSELQLVRNPSTSLIVLSACQTNAGKLATGEGVFSLTRGFASAGISSVAATLWKADEEAIYSITELFLQNIAAGMRKDEALQKAKLSFLKNGGDKAAMPFYWANMVLAGNTEPIKLSSTSGIWWWVAGGAVLALLLLLLVGSWRKKARSTSTI